MSIFTRRLIRPIFSASSSSINISGSNLRSFSRLLSYHHSSDHFRQFSTASNSEIPRIVTAGAIFDGHDASINIMRRIMQSSGAEVIHLGHNCSAEKIVQAAIDEDAHAIAATSYQGGHMEFFTYMHELLKKSGANDIKIFGGGGGTILPDEIKTLHDSGITRIYSPDDGRSLGLQGMINDLMDQVKFPKTYTGELNSESIMRQLNAKDPHILARLISIVENDKYLSKQILDLIQPFTKNIPILGITGTGGSGKSTVIDEFLRRFIRDFPDKRVAVISIDPTRKKTGGALLGDRIRINAVTNSNIFFRSLATRTSSTEISDAVTSIIQLMKAAPFDLILVETAGIGQSNSEIANFVDVSMYILTQEYGSALQLEKLDMLDFANIITLNKFDKPGSEDAKRDIIKQYRRNHGIFDLDQPVPVFGTVASQFNNHGMNILYSNILQTIEKVTGAKFQSLFPVGDKILDNPAIISSGRENYLSHASRTVRDYNKRIAQEAETINQLQTLLQFKDYIAMSSTDTTPLSDEIEDGCNESTSDTPIEPILKKTDALQAEIEKIYNSLSDEAKDKFDLIQNWANFSKNYDPENKTFTYVVRGREIKLPNYTESLSGLAIPKVVLPSYRSWADLYRWLSQENVPGTFPFTGGVFPFRRMDEGTTRMFAGQGSPENTNRRFHYLKRGIEGTRLSTAFDAVTLYGEDPEIQPDFYGKIGNSGVSVPTLNDMKILFSGFDLIDPNTSVSMTINGPAPFLLAMFFNTAIDQECEKYIREHHMEDLVHKKLEEISTATGIPHRKYSEELPEDHNGQGLLLLGITGDKILPPDIYEKIKLRTLTQVRGTVQADILKEDQAQNTCIFTPEFALRLMGDAQEYFIHKKVRNFYSVSISGYHIAEAGANPLTQVAFTLANGLTYVEYYANSRHMDVNQFARNLSYFFSNGMDIEYSVIGRAARRVWSKIMKYNFSADERSQKLKYHIQTSGRSLHAQEIAFNDIRTTLQAVLGIYDNCNSLHTNSFDEAITTPTEQSVRQAQAIQLIINKEFGLTKNENVFQGSFLIEKLTDIVEEAILIEFDRINKSGGVLGAMEKGYQRSKIQDQSMLYEMRKSSGEHPIVGVNTFLGPDGSPSITIPLDEVIRSSDIEKKRQIDSVSSFLTNNYDNAIETQEMLRNAVYENSNVFEVIMEAIKYNSIGSLTHILYEVGGEYRRNL